MATSRPGRLQVADLRRRLLEPTAVAGLDADAHVPSSGSRHHRWRHGTLSAGGRGRAARGRRRSPRSPRGRRRPPAPARPRRVGQVDLHHVVAPRRASPPTTPGSAASGRPDAPGPRRSVAHPPMVPSRPDTAAPGGVSPHPLGASRPAPWPGVGEGDPGAPCPPVVLPAKSSPAAPVPLRQITEPLSPPSLNAPPADLDLVVEGYTRRRIDRHAVDLDRGDHGCARSCGHLLHELVGVDVEVRAAPASAPGESPGSRHALERATAASTRFAGRRRPGTRAAPPGPAPRRRRPGWRTASHAARRSPDVVVGQDGGPPRTNPERAAGPTVGHRQAGRSGGPLLELAGRGEGGPHRRSPGRRAGRAPAQSGGPGRPAPAAAAPAPRRPTARAPPAWPAAAAARGRPALAGESGCRASGRGGCDE